ncbi:hypothetical protein A4X13_0g6048 [Tilletia indica]|uniref:Fungal lipase-type domain-containing protein n=1 Tax=Tilletia indica TaxID=43049 RepID=A0A177TSQ0_9BASI|nr:hypothetical protein A4X13_0g6048 [Tilletia indica]
MSCLLLLAALVTFVSASPLPVNTESSARRISSSPSNFAQSAPRPRLVKVLTNLLKVNLTNILSAPDPALALGRTLSGSDLPDPVSSITSSPNPLTNTDSPLPLPADIRNTIIQKTTMYSGAAYCPSVEAGNWTCGMLCDANPDFNLTSNGGDGSSKQRWFAGWNPTTKEIIVARQGSDFSHLLTFLYVADFLPQKLNAEAAKTFSRLPNSSRASSPQIPVGPLTNNLSSPLTGPSLADYAVVNMGFQSAWSQTYSDIKTQVQALLEAHPDAFRVFVTGHSLGATIAVLDGIALRNVVPTSVQVEVSVTGQPRVGNPVFAALLDQLVQTPAENFVYHRITNHADIFPHLFPLITGYQHSSNEIWIPTANSNFSTPAVLCPGKENQNCALSQVLSLTMTEHAGPYFGHYVGVPADCRA